MTALAPELGPPRASSTLVELYSIFDFFIEADAMTVLKTIKQVAPLLDMSGFIMILVAPIGLYVISKCALICNLGYCRLSDYIEIIIPGEMDLFYNLNPSHMVKKSTFFVFDFFIIISILLSMFRVALETIQLIVGQNRMKRRNVEIYYNEYFNVRKLAFYLFTFGVLILGYYAIFDVVSVPHDVFFRDSISKAPYMFISAQLFCFLTLNLFSSGIVPVLILDLFVLFRIRIGDK